MELDQLLMDRQRMRALLAELGEMISREGKVVEIAIFGGSALVLQFDFREGTEDVDYIPVRGDNALLKRLATKVAARHGLHEDWINDAVWLNPQSRRGCTKFLGDFPFHKPGLRVFVAQPEYIFAMKVLAMRSSAVTKDVEDIWHLWDHLGITSAQQAIDLTQSYYPGKTLPIRNIRLLEDIDAAKRDGLSYSPMMGW